MDQEQQKLQAPSSSYRRTTIIVADVNCGNLYELVHYWAVYVYKVTSSSLFADGMGDDQRRWGEKKKAEARTAVLP